MDNIAHSLLSISLCTAIFPQHVTKQKWLFWGTSILLANIPDIDILLLLSGSQNYFFYHRGLTHSLFGLLIFFPLLYFITANLFKKSLIEVPKSKIVILILCQIAITHYLLDYLTSYGTMFLYPFSLHKFAYPLMFIIDPIFWLIGLMALLLFFKFSKDSVAIQKIATASLFAFVLLWTVELSFKKYAEHNYAHQAHCTGPQGNNIISFPAPLAPLSWSLLEKDTNQVACSQGMVNFHNSLSKPDVGTFKIPSEFNVNKLCTGDYSQAAQQAFQKYLTWGVDVACRNYLYKGENGCKCSSLKYSILALDRLYFGQYFISKTGNAEILPDQLDRRIFDTGFKKTNDGNNE